MTSILQQALDSKSNQIYTQAKHDFHLYIAKGGKNFKTYTNQVTGDTMVQINEEWASGWSVLTRSEAVEIWEYQKSRTK